MKVNCGLSCYEHQLVVPSYPGKECPNCKKLMRSENIIEPCDCKNCACRKKETATESHGWHMHKLGHPNY